MGCDVTVRRVGPDELDELVAWRMEVLRCVFELPEDADVSALREENLRYYREELPRGGHVAAFAELGGERVGCAALCLQREMPSPDNPDGRCAYLMNVYVRPAHRGRGVARALVSRLVSWARERGIPKVYLETTPAARPLYESLGFRDMPDYMILADSRTPGGAR